MKKKRYLQPATEVTGILPLRLLTASRGWSQDGNSPFDVGQEDDVDEEDLEDDGGYGGFLDLD